MNKFSKNIKINPTKLLELNFPIDQLDLEIPTSKFEESLKFYNYSLIHIEYFENADGINTVISKLLTINTLDLLEIVSNLEPNSELIIHTANPKAKILKLINPNISTIIL